VEEVGVEVFHVRPPVEEVEVEVLRVHPVEVVAGAQDLAVAVPGKII
jgi:hypothetical protein